ncbi:tetratricopeptide repeat protein [Methylovulum sp.]|uniref:tetratricopeptide repeat protein n=1 Tax=Methylovulum sp. TaxID=1916980 RepID=UPI002603AE6A|nr:tetratricopeptide repeat protein [Methylovulum sp.]MDD5124974.1 tetratricopeptide repeat protein [Methylovulum sp.]
MHKQRYLNKKKIVFTLSMALILPLGCDKEKDAREHLQKGVEYLNKGDYQKAELELKTSSQANKEIAETYYHLALIEEKKRNFKAMKENLIKLIELAPTHTQARLKLARALLLLNEVDAANEQVKIVSKSASYDVDIEILKASVLLRQKKQQEALKVIDGALKENPNHAGVLALKAMVFFEKGDVNTALSLIDRAIKSDPKNIAMHLFKIEMHTKIKDEKAVIGDYQLLVSLYPDNQAFKVMLAEQYAKAGKNKEAEALLRAILVDAPDEVTPKLLLLDFLRVTNKEKSLEEFHLITEQYKDHPSMLFYMANWMSSKRNFEEANTVLNRIIELEKNTEVGLAAKVLLAKNAFDDKNYDKADKLVTEVLKVNTSLIDAKIVRARLFLVKKQYDDAIKLLNEISWSKPDSDEVLLLLGQSFLNKGDKEEADKYFVRALSTNPANLNALAYVYQKALEKNDIPYAKQVIEEALKLVPGNLDLLQQLARVNLSTQDWNGAKAVSETIANVANPLAADLANHIQAQIFYGKADYAKAVEIYKKLLIKYPQNRNVLVGLIECYERTNKRAEMVAILNDLLIKDPKNLSAALLLANLYFLDKKYDKGTVLLTDLIKGAPRNTEAYDLLAKAKLAQNDSKGAIDVLREALKQNPYDITLSLLLTSLYEAQSDYDSALLIYDALVNKYPDLDVAINNLASLLSDHYDNNKDKVDKAVKLASKFKDSNQPYLKDTYAWALIKQGRVNEGMVILTQVVASAPDVPIFTYHLGVAHYKLGDNTSAISELKQAVQLAKQKGVLAEQKAAETLLKTIVDKNSTR